ncbi:FtsX-like permease family protein [Nocardioides jejuensis]|uniref:FtsX-like permease family protein n=1 Tax=Nocardioides jejuensis TaxID=2502782 RepID=A0A4R1CDI2_9ACTN|nr:FtsX-like permease family protein [Nocardioides jejuensis]TCJ28275.1 FtsX-like permease family protein [Nocardioides jejuensis]
MTGFTPLLRLAWRDLWRNKGRTTVVFLMILLPVLGVSAASTVIATAGVSPALSIDREWGTADVRVAVGNTYGYDDGDSTVTAPKVVDVVDTLQATVQAAVGPDALTARRLLGNVRVTTDDGAARVDAVETDLRSPLATGTYRLIDGRLPRVATEVVVNGHLADAGPGLGEKLAVRDGHTLDVVGVVEDGSSKSGVRAWSLPGGLIADPHAAGAVHDVFVFARAGSGEIANERLDGLRARDIAADTRQEQLWADRMYISASDFAVVVLIVVMAITEVVLLAGPAFAVSARRRQRELALVAASGGTPRQVRSAVLATAVVIGVLGALIGVGLGIAAGWAAVPIIQARVDEYFGDFHVIWWQVAGVAVFGLVSAVLAALVPAWIASRQDVVRVLTGRRGDPAPARFSPLLGIVLGALGVLLTAVGVEGDTGTGEIWIGFGAVSTVLGAVALMPLLLRIVARLTGRAPLVVRYAVRDGLRHRTRTVPAIGAVMATVAGVVALGIANSSDQAAGEKEYQTQAPMGHGVVYLFSDMSYGPGEAAASREDVIAAVTSIAPDARVVRGPAESDGTAPYQDITMKVGGSDYWGESHGPFSQAVQVVSSVDEMYDELPASSRTAAAKVLARGGAIVLGQHVPSAHTATVTVHVGDQDDPEGGARAKARVTMPALPVTTSAYPAANLVIGDRTAAKLGLKVVPAGMVIARDVSRAEEKSLDAAVTDVSESASVYVERGWQPDPSYAIVMMVLTAVGALLMVGGTLTATVLALADAGPDLATLSAVGAAPRTSRAVAMGIAFVIGGIGAVLGVIVGAVPGIAATWPLTDHDFYYEGVTYQPGQALNAHTIDIPWLLLAEIAVGVPVLLALAVGLFARSRLPLVARID